MLSKSSIAFAALSMVLTAVVSTPSAAQAQTAYRPALDTHAFRQNLAGRPTQVLILAASHLSNFSSFKPEYADTLVGKLAAFDPQIIAIEALSGVQCDGLRRFDARHPGLATRYCFSTEAAGTAFGVDVPTATIEALKLMAEVATDPTPAKRRRLAGLFMAGGEPASAVVQWLRLDAAERLENDGLTAELVRTLNSLSVKNNESYIVGARLAAERGLERVYSMDDHTADDILYGMDEAAGPAIEQIWNTSNPTLDAMRAMDVPTDGESTLAIFRFNNLPETQVNLAIGEHGLATSQDSPGLYGRQYTAWWEVRNERMASNIRSCFSDHPGARVLVIVGGTHKPYLEAYLDQIHEVELVDAMKVLQ